MIQKHWREIKDGNPTALAIFLRHYSAKPDRPNSKRFVGPGERLVLLTHDNTALFVWRRELYRRDSQYGINCPVFRNEGYPHTPSSELIKESMKLALVRWPNQRLFTFVNIEKITSSNPGYCFQMAGWNKCGFTKINKLLILEYPPQNLTFL